MRKGILSVVVSVLFLGVSPVFSQGCFSSLKQCGLESSEKECKVEDTCPILVKGADVKIKNIKNGVVITITSKEKKVVKEIQKKAAECRKCIKASSKTFQKKTKKATNDEMVVCPVMGTKMKKSKAVDSTVYKEKTYYFCCDGCKPAFEKNPGKYIK